MANFEYNESDLPEVVPEELKELKDGGYYRLVNVGDWSMEWDSEYMSGESDSELEYVDQAILSWIAYRAWLVKNPGVLMEKE